MTETTAPEVAPEVAPSQSYSASKKSKDGRDAKTSQTKFKKEDTDVGSAAMARDSEDGDNLFQRSDLPSLVDEGEGGVNVVIDDEGDDDGMGDDYIEDSSHCSSEKRTGGNDSQRKKHARRRRRRHRNDNQTPDSGVGSVAAGGSLSSPRHLHSRSDHGGSNSQAAGARNRRLVNPNGGDDDDPVDVDNDDDYGGDDDDDCEDFDDDDDALYDDSDSLNLNTYAVPLQTQQHPHQPYIHPNRPDGIQIVEWSIPPGLEDDSDYISDAPSDFSDDYSRSGREFLRFKSHYTDDDDDDEFDDDDDIYGEDHGYGGSVDDEIFIGDDDDSSLASSSSSEDSLHRGKRQHGGRRRRHHQHHRGRASLSGRDDGGSGTAVPPGDGSVNEHSYGSEGSSGSSVGGPAAHLGNLLDHSNSEYSDEIDPLFDASQTLKLFADVEGSQLDTTVVAGVGDSDNEHLAKLRKRQEQQVLRQQEEDAFWLGQFSPEKVESSNETYSGPAPTPGGDGATSDAAADAKASITEEEIFQLLEHLKHHAKLMLDGTDTIDEEDDDIDSSDSESESKRKSQALKSPTGAATASTPLSSKPALSLEDGLAKITAESPMANRSQRQQRRRGRRKREDADSDDDGKHLYVRDDSDDSFDCDDVMMDDDDGTDTRSEHTSFTQSWEKHQKIGGVGVGKSLVSSAPLSRLNPASPSFLSPRPGPISSLPSSSSSATKKAASELVQFLQQHQRMSPLIEGGKATSSPRQEQQQTGTGENDESSMRSFRVVPNTASALDDEDDQAVLMSVLEPFLAMKDGRQTTTSQTKANVKKFLSPARMAKLLSPRSGGGIGTGAVGKRRGRKGQAGDRKVSAAMSSSKRKDKGGMPPALPLATTKPSGSSKEKPADEDSEKWISTKKNISSKIGYYPEDGQTGPGGRRLVILSRNDVGENKMFWSAFEFTTPLRDNSRMPKQSKKHFKHVKTQPGSASAAAAAAGSSATTTVSVGKQNKAKKSKLNDSGNISVSSKKSSSSSTATPGKSTSTPSVTGGTSSSNNNNSKSSSHSVSSKAKKSHKKSKRKASIDDTVDDNNDTDVTSEESDDDDDDGHSNDKSNDKKQPKKGSNNKKKNKKKDKIRKRGRKADFENEGATDEDEKIIARLLGNMSDDRARSLSPVLVREAKINRRGGSNAIFQMAENLGSMLTGPSREGGAKSKNAKLKSQHPARINAKAGERSRSQERKRRSQSPELRDHQMSLLLMDKTATTTAAAEVFGEMVLAAGSGRGKNQKLKKQSSSGGTTRDTRAGFDGDRTPSDHSTKSRKARSQQQQQQQPTPSSKRYIGDDDDEDGIATGGADKDPSSDHSTKSKLMKMKSQGPSRNGEDGMDLPDSSEHTSARKAKKAASQKKVKPDFDSSIGSISLNPGDDGAEELSDANGHKFRAKKNKRGKDDGDDPSDHSSKSKKGASKKPPTQSTTDEDDSDDYSEYEVGLKEGTPTKVKKAPTKLVKSASKALEEQDSGLKRPKLKKQRSAENANELYRKASGDKDGANSNAAANSTRTSKLRKQRSAGNVNEVTLKDDSAHKGADASKGRPAKLRKAKSLDGSGLVDPKEDETGPTKKVKSKLRRTRTDSVTSNDSFGKRPKMRKQRSAGNLSESVRSDTSSLDEYDIYDDYVQHKRVHRSLGNMNHSATISTADNLGLDNGSKHRTPKSKKQQGSGRRWGNSLSTKRDKRPSTASVASGSSEDELYDSSRGKKQGFLGALKDFLSLGDRSSFAEQNPNDIMHKSMSTSVDGRDLTFRSDTRSDGTLSDHSWHSGEGRRLKKVKAQRNAKSQRRDSLRSHSEHAARPDDLLFRQFVSEEKTKLKSSRSTRRLSGSLSHAGGTNENDGANVSKGLHKRSGSFGDGFFDEEGELFLGPGSIPDKSSRGMLLKRSGSLGKLNTSTHSAGKNDELRRRQYRRLKGTSRNDEGTGPSRKSKMDIQEKELEKKAKRNRSKSPGKLRGRKSSEGIELVGNDDKRRAPKGSKVKSPGTLKEKRLPEGQASFDGDNDFRGGRSYHGDTKSTMSEEKRSTKSGSTGKQRSPGSVKVLKSLHDFTGLRGTEVDGGSLHGDNKSQASEDRRAVKDQMKAAMAGKPRKSLDGLKVLNGPESKQKNKFGSRSVDSTGRRSKGDRSKSSNKALKGTKAQLSTSQSSGRSVKVSKPSDDNSVASSKGPLESQIAGSAKQFGSPGKRPATRGEKLKGTTKATPKPPPDGASVSVASATSDTNVSGLWSTSSSAADTFAIDKYGSPSIRSHKSSKSKGSKGSKLSSSSEHIPSDPWKEVIGKSPSLHTAGFGTTDSHEDVSLSDADFLDSRSFEDDVVVEATATATGFGGETSSKADSRHVSTGISMENKSVRSHKSALSKGSTVTNNSTNSRGKVSVSSSGTATTFGETTTSHTTTPNKRRMSGTKTNEVNFSPSPGVWSKVSGNVKEKNKDQRQLPSAPPLKSPSQGPSQSSSSSSSSSTQQRSTGKSTSMSLKPVPVPPPPPPSSLSTPVEKEDDDDDEEEKLHGSTSSASSSSTSSSSSSSSSSASDSSNTTSSSSSSSTNSSDSSSSSDSSDSSSSDTPPPLPQSHRSVGTASTASSSTAAASERERQRPSSSSSLSSFSDWKNMMHWH